VHFQPIEKGVPIEYLMQSDAKKRSDVALICPEDNFGQFLFLIRKVPAFLSRSS
jgi:hypothetical protein